MKYEKIFCSHTIYFNGPTNYKHDYPPYMLSKIEIDKKHQ